MLIAIIVIAVVVVAAVVGLLALRSRGASNDVSLTPDPRTHARDNTNPATAADQQRTQGNAGGIGGAF